MYRLSLLDTSRHDHQPYAPGLDKSLSNSPSLPFWIFLPATGFTDIKFP